LREIDNDSKIVGFMLSKKVKKVHCWWHYAN